MCFLSPSLSVYPLHYTGYHKLLLLCYSSIDLFSIEICIVISDCWTDVNWRLSCSAAYMANLYLLCTIWECKVWRSELYDCMMIMMVCWIVHHTRVLEHRKQMQLDAHLPYMFNFCVREGGRIQSGPPFLANRSSTIKSHYMCHGKTIVWRVS